jgi:hypothetical protein
VDIAGTAIVLLLLFCAVLAIVFHRCTRQRRNDRERTAIEYTRAATLLQRCEESREQLRQLLTRFRVECEERVDNVRREASDRVAGALRELDQRDHESAVQQRRVVSQHSLRYAAAAMDQQATPLLDLEQDIRQAYGVLSELQDQYRLSSDPIERERLATGADRTRADLVALLRQYEEATDALCEPMAADIGKIAILLGE